MSVTFSPDSGVVFAHPIPPLHPDSWTEAPVVVQAQLAPNNLIQVGAFTGIYGSGKIGHSRIGRYCSIAPGVDIASDQHPSDWLSTSMVQYVPNIHDWGGWLQTNGYGYQAPAARFNSNSAVTIGNDVWIGQGVFIKSGVTIGDGAIVAAHSVVVDDVPPYGIVAGVPARLKRLRFAEAIVEQLCALKWWDYNVMAVGEHLNRGGIEANIEVLQDKIASGTLIPYVAPKHMLARPPGQ